MLEKPLVLFHWGVSRQYAYGIIGLNLMLAWAKRTDLAVASLLRIDEDALDLDPLERHALTPAIRRTETIQIELHRDSGRRVETPHMILRTINNASAPPLTPYGVDLWSHRTVGLAIFVDTDFPEARLHYLRHYPLVVVASSWCGEMLHEAGIPSQLVWHGVDPAYFHPAPRRGLFPGRFLVFSGGKIEYRKGQDIVLRAFKIFADRYPEALLVTSWSSPWPFVAESLGPSLPQRSNGQVDVPAFAASYGIGPSQIIELGEISNRDLPQVMRDANVAIFPNRAEPGTNMVAMECIACGVPTVLSVNTGHRDLIAAGNLLPLERQTSIPGASYRGWGESDVDEIVDRLEFVRNNPVDADLTALVASDWMTQITWDHQMNVLGDMLVPFTVA